MVQSLHTGAGGAAAFAGVERAEPSYHALVDGAVGNLARCVPAAVEVRGNQREFGVFAPLGVFGHAVEALEILVCVEESVVGKKR